MTYKHIIISRTDAIGDVTLTLPVCGFLKANFPGIRISFLGRTYTGPVIKCCSAVDEFINYDDLRLLPENEQVTFLRNTSADVFIHVFPVAHLANLARKASIKLRIGTRNRLFHWTTCNRLVSLSRKNSTLHESALNLLLLRPLGIHTFPAAGELYRYYDFTRTIELPFELRNLLSNSQFNLVLHPKSHGSGKEWSLERYRTLVSQLGTDYRIFISGSLKEQVALKEWIRSLPGTNIVDITGLMTLDQLIAFFHLIDGLLASGTGPLHLAAASGVNTLGIFPATRPIHGVRWAPLGEKAHYISAPGDDLNEVTAEEVYREISRWKK